MDVLIRNTKPEDLFLAARAANSYLREYPNEKLGHVIIYLYGYTDVDPNTASHKAGVRRNKASITVEVQRVNS